MKKNILHFILSASASALLLTLPACDDGDGGGGAKDVCEQSGDVLVQDCMLESESGGSGGQAAACEGDAAAGAQCIVDNPDDACAFFDAVATDPTNIPDNAYTQCVAMIGG